MKLAMVLTRCWSNEKASSGLLLIEAETVWSSAVPAFATSSSFLLKTALSIDPALLPPLTGIPSSQSRTSSTKAMDNSLCS